MNYSSYSIPKPLAEKDLQRAERERVWKAANLKNVDLQLVSIKNSIKTVNKQAVMRSLKMLNISKNEQKQIAIYVYNYLQKRNKKEQSIKQSISSSSDNDFYENLPASRVSDMINYTVFLHKFYSKQLNLNDLKQDLVLFYLENQNKLKLCYRKLAKKCKHERDYHVSFSYYLLRRFIRYLRARVNFYLYAVNIPYTVKNQFKLKNELKQEKRNVACKDSSDLFLVRSSEDVIGTELYFRAVTKIEIAKANSIDLFNYNDLDIIKLKNHFTDTNNRLLESVFNLRIEGFRQREIAAKLQISVDKVKKLCQKINSLSNKI